MHRIEHQAHRERPAASGAAQTACERIVSDGLLRARPVLARRLCSPNMADRPRRPIEVSIDELGAAWTLNREAIDAGEEAQRPGRELGDARHSGAPPGRHRLGQPRVRGAAALPAVRPRALMMHTRDPSGDDVGWLQLLQPA
jgi:hypothetical protein